MISSPSAEGPDAALVRGLPSLLANMLIARIDFLLRFLMSMLYGASRRPSVRVRVRVRDPGIG